MTLDYTEGGTFKVSMIDYIYEIIDAFDKEDPRRRGIKTSAAPDDLYKVDEDGEKISTKKAKMFHNLVEKNLYTTKQARPDTCTEVAFLKTRVREQKRDYRYNLVHLMKYIKGD